MKIQPVNLNFYTNNNKKNKRSNDFVSVPKTLQHDTVEFKNTNSATFKGKVDDEKTYSEGAKKVTELVKYMSSQREFNSLDENKFLYCWADFREIENPDIQNMYHGSKDSPACKELVQLIRSYSGIDDAHSSPINEDLNQAKFIKELLIDLLRRGLIINDEEYSKLLLSSASQKQYKMLNDLIYYCEMQDKSCQKTTLKLLQDLRFSFPGDDELEKNINYFEGKCETINSSYGSKIHEDSEGAKKVKEIIKIFSEIKDYTTEDKNKLITALTDFEEMDNPEIQDMYHGSDDTPACKELVDLIKSYSGTDNGSLPLDEDEVSDDNNKADFIRALLFDLLQNGLKIEDASYLELMENALENNQPKMLELLIENFKVMDVRLQEGIAGKIIEQVLYYNTSFSECGYKISKKCRELIQNGKNPESKTQKNDKTADTKTDNQKKVNITKKTGNYEEICDEILEKYDIYDIKNWSEILDEISEYDDEKSSNTIRFVVENLSDIFYSDDNKNDYKKIIERLQTINGNWNITDKNLGSNLAHKSLMAENPLLLQLAYDKEVDFLQKDISGKMPLDLMNEFDGSEEVIEVFNNMKINYPLIIELASSGVAAGIKMLLKKPYIDINSVDENGNNAGISAVEHDRVNVIKLLNNINSFDINYVNPQNGKSALLSVKNPETLTAILDNPQIELYDENKIPIMYKFIAQVESPLKVHNIREIFKALLTHPKIDITERYKGKTIADALKNYVSDSTNIVKHQHNFYNELSEILNDAVSFKMHEKTKKIADKNGLLSLKEINDFIECPNANSVINLPLNDENEPIGFFVADIPADFKNISEILKIMTTLTEKGYDYSLKNTMGQTMLDKAKDADNELLVDYITQIMQVKK